MLTSEHTVNIYCKEGASCPLILNILSHLTFHSIPFCIVCLEDVVCPSCLFSFSLYLMKDCSSKIDLSVFCRKKGKRLPNAGRSVGPGDKDKSEKGLRHFSMKVCEKVQQKRTTSYNEVQAKNIQSILFRYCSPEWELPCIIFVLGINCVEGTFY